MRRKKLTTSKTTSQIFSDKLRADYRLKERHYREEFKDSISTLVDARHRLFEIDKRTNNPRNGHQMTIFDIIVG